MVLLGLNTIVQCIYGGICKVECSEGLKTTHPLTGDAIWYDK